MSENPTDPRQQRTERLEELFDAYVGILEDIVGGRSPVLDRDGHAVTDDQGNAVFELPSASHLKRAAEIFDRLRIGVVPTTGSASGRLLDAAKSNGWRIGGEAVDESRLPADDVEAV